MAFINILRRSTYIFFLYRYEPFLLKYYIKYKFINTQEQYLTIANAIGKAIFETSEAIKIKPKRRDYDF
jgi:hypothetical protein